ncbi:MAG: prepilin-type N-terminal cleavage/methylation domain-containing protein, partial [Planctomycetes bacterium]|nr:prepilin-type N-terminal cleavage/methylation domain-containing protein [Planctomycetota bacterium]
MNRVTQTTRPKFFIPHRRRGRQGMSLLEVLISIFVLSFGLMGVAALLPLGTFQVVEAGKADQAASCARAAFREVKARRMLDPDQWVAANGNPAPYWAHGGNALVIDPLMIADQAVQGVAANLFPWVPSPGIAVPRITLDANPDPQQRLWMGPAVARRIFTWSDDPNIHRPKDSSLRP